jgi:hypothetical protein
MKGWIDMNAHYFLLFRRTDPDRPFAHYDLSKDAKKLLEGMEVQENVGFTRVKHFPPKQNAGEVQQKEVEVLPP